VNAQELSKVAKNNQPNMKQLYYSNASAEQQIAKYIRNTFQDKKGHLWFGTNGYGIAHYNGEKLSYYSVEQGFNGGQILGITEDLEQNIWFATEQGIVKYDWSSTATGDKKFINFSDPMVFSPSHIRSLFSDSKGTIWVGTIEGVSRFSGTTLETFDLPYSVEHDSGSFYSNRTVWSISEDKNGNLWFGTNGNGAFKYDGKSFKQYTKKDGLAGNDVDVIIEDRKGNMWFGTRYGGISRYNGKTFVNYTQNDSIGNNEICAIYEDKIGNIWFSSEGYGVYRYDGESLTNYSDHEGLRVKAVQTIFEDKEGRFWVGGSGGLYRYDGISFFHVTKDGPWE
jgi:ligand-binding sensor domain-containing protein